MKVNDKYIYKNKVITITKLSRKNIYFQGSGIAGGVSKSYGEKVFKAIPKAVPKIITTVPSSPISISPITTTTTTTDINEPIKSKNKLYLIIMAIILIIYFKKH